MGRSVSRFFNAAVETARYCTFIISAGGRGGAAEEQIASERCLSSSLYKLHKCIYRVILEIKVSYSESQDFVYILYVGSYDVRRSYRK